MGIRLIILNHQSGAEQGRRRVGHPVIGYVGFKPVGRLCRNKTHGQGREVMSKASAEVIDPTLPRKAAGCVDRLVTVPQTDSGGQVENTKALERTLVKELGKLTL